MIDSITERFFLHASHPHLGRARDDDFGVGARRFPVAEYDIIYCLKNADVLILRVAHGRRDIAALFDQWPFASFMNFLERYLHEILSLAKSKTRLK